MNAGLGNNLYKLGFLTPPTMNHFSPMVQQQPQGATSFGLPPCATPQGSEEKHQLALDLAYRPGRANFLLPLQFYLGEPRTSEGIVVMPIGILYVISL